MTKAHLIYNGVFITNIINEIKIQKDSDFNTSPYVGSVGSTTNHISTNGRVITCKSLVTYDQESRHGRLHRINDYIALAENNRKKPKVMTSPSKSEIDGNYIITGFEYTEDTGNNFIIDWEFTEVIKFNVTEKTFRVWGKASTAKTKKTTAKKTTTKKATTKISISSNTKTLLKKCGTMKKGSSSKTCVKSLQKFLQSQGYYKGYKIDGVYAIYTYKAVQNLQKKYKLKVTGSWDKNTRSYFQKKYKYP